MKSKITPLKRYCVAHRYLIDIYFSSSVFSESEGQTNHLEKCQIQRQEEQSAAGPVTALLIELPSVSFHTGSKDI